MGRPKGSKNKNQDVRPATSELNTEQRMHLLASLLVETIILESESDYPLLKKLKYEGLLCLE